MNIKKKFSFVNDSIQQTHPFIQPMFFEQLLYRGLPVLSSYFFVLEMEISHMLQIVLIIHTDSCGSFGTWGLCGVGGMETYLRGSNMLLLGETVRTQEKTIAY